MQRNAKDCKETQQAKTPLHVTHAKNKPSKATQSKSMQRGKGRQSKAMKSKAK